MIKLEFNGENPTALKHLGQALVDMANEMTGATMAVDKAKPGSEITVKANVTVENDELIVQLDEPVESNPKYDANGLPWDERIHSGSKARNKDDTWKKRKGVDEATVAAVTEELQALMSIPVEEPKSEQVANDAETQQANVTASQPEADAPPPPPPLVNDVPKSEAINQDAPPPPPPGVTGVADAGNTQGDAEASVKFVDITKFITGTIVKNGVKTMPEITAAITAEYGVPFPTLAKRNELWPEVMVFLEKMNNESNT